MNFQVTGGYVVVKSLFAFCNLITMCCLKFCIVVFNLSPSDLFWFQSNLHYVEVCSSKEEIDTDLVDG